MGPQEVDILMALITGAVSISALGMFLRYRIKMRSTLSKDDVRRIIENQEELLDSVDEIRRELSARDNELRELSGRVEFAERLLTQGQEPDSH